ncbi:hypothetical protein M409DRAFT_28197 [Zasmidium cellare ATCC 36951]|uniref:Uncharacterized protein n=1 Tax=Zasmidium cellare ATCC 36951 TaxID=1080233 RepID=A0A6A6C5D1_ZASCE|nr:uncharacterized protein M409DRAFT_28197 [Zasmidium cellare ATCC 36951]KAF2161468.1 hypothetical protein M409DRAFT_28197 [Zasmidium cellare ATCC 36951]
MKYILALIVAASSAYARVRPPRPDAFSATVWDTSTPDNSASTIQNLQTTLTVPALPSQQGLFLWPGLYAEGDWLVQTILTNDGQYLNGGCDTGGANGWCVQAYQYSGSKDNGVGPATLVKEGDQLEITYQYNPYVGTMQQTTVLGQTGQTLLNYTFGCGPGVSLVDSIECHAAIDNVPQHTYTNTRIQLSSPNLSFNTSLNADNSSPNSFASTDDGTNWFIPEITLYATSCECDSNGFC